ncbi:MAG: MarR family transcriptional regulator [Planctomycetes bacterium]|nr:MarR family transcriptional regulator [Planctomycetota bacterium]
MTGKSAAALWVRLAKCHGLVLRHVQHAQARIDQATTLPQFDVLAQLSRHPEGMTAGALSRALLVTAGNVTGIVSRLVARGLVARSLAPSDRRSVVLRLTPAGRRAARAQVARHERALGRILGGMPRRSQVEVARSLDRLRDALEMRKGA